MAKDFHVYVIEYDGKYFCLTNQDDVKEFQNIFDCNVRKINVYRNKYKKKDSIPEEIDLSYRSVTRRDKNYIGIGAGTFARKTCRVCGKELKIFNTGKTKGHKISLNNKWVNHCSVDCYRKETMIIPDRECVKCGTKFPPYKNNQYCSKCKEEKNGK